MVFHGISIISAPHNMGVDTLFVQLSSLLTEIWPTNEFSVMAALICIQIVRGTFCQLVNIANRFLRIFSNLETLIRFIFPGGAGYPYLPTQLYEQMNKVLQGYWERMTICQYRFHSIIHVHSRCFSLRQTFETVHMCVFIMTGMGNPFLTTVSKLITLDAPGACISYVLFPNL